MCEPATTSMIVMGAMSAATAAAGAVAQQQAASAQKKAIDTQSEIRGKQIQAAGGQQENIAAQQAREQRAAGIAAASGAGINLGSDSFMASMQTTTMNQSNEDGLIMENESNQVQANTAETQSVLNSKASSSTFLGATLDTALAGAGSYMRGSASYQQGADKPTPNVG